MKSLPILALPKPKPRRRRVSSKRLVEENAMRQVYIELTTPLTGLPGRRVG